MDTEHTKLKAFLFPWLAYGHISPFLELAKKLSDRGFLIELCSTPINLSFIQKRIPQSYSSTIQLVELILPEFPQLPPHYHTTNGLPLHLNSTLHKALKLAKPNLFTILKTRKPDLIIYDVMQLWTFGVASSLNIPSARFFTSGAAMCSYFVHLYKNLEVEYPFPALHLYDYEIERARKLVQRNDKENENKDDQPEEEMPPQEGIMLISTSKELEGKYMNYLAEIIETRILPIGTLVQDPVASVEGNVNIMQWLDSKKELSTVFVSFGSEYFLTKEEREEIALGLELSQVNFIWVVRFPKGEKQNLEEALPQGFLERVGDRGMIVEWAPQAKILTHSSIGGFVSHCGWNSISESIEFGVPIIAIPMQLDQPMNAKLLVEIGVALEVVRDDNGSLHREEIASVIKDVTSGESSETMRCKVRNLGKNLRTKSVEDMDATVEELRELVGESTSKNGSF
ncbi:beta-D-glucosyl crocetin beta-1,6-glucosyltransferase-like [Nicotiana tabacum]|uniref:Glycosyltransferase n=1 Tax=Nicotiana tabacum TaxID=4097 RepID=A0A1S4CCD6_TOBAC|nr:PREDICTED: beta-D-glucosyl crocetin beta-1,6-glucosyltransferase-like [Nicotiana tabacum]WIW42773.1 UDP-glycosyltransferase [Nicotiana tabacum]